MLRRVGAVTTAPNTRVSAPRLLGISLAYFLVLLEPSALWSSSLVLRFLLEYEGVAPEVVHAACVVYLCNPVLFLTLGYLFHMECFLPLLVLGLYVCYRRRRPLAYWAVLLLALMVKEDVGLYLAGFALYVAVADGRWRLGLATGTVSLL